ncbi:MAG TPA: type II secretion system protein, partial [Thermoleophilia bacterium]|nr:type II secretion system protein [Thermoleophilia bacterium]
MFDNVFCHERPRSDGFSLIELLITIVLAGIVFAAMVPLFVNASQKSAGDNLRDISVQVAQDKIEKLRTIDYDSINNTNFATTTHQTYAGGQFADFNYVQGGTTKVIHVSYAVSLFPATATPGTEQYKIVSINSWWDGSPYPHKTTVLQTNIYKQYAGPQLTDFSLTNADGSDIGAITVTNPDGSQTSVYAITDFPVDMSVQIPAADLVSMNPGDGSYGLMQFSITNTQGTTVDSQVVYPTKAAQTAQAGSASGALWGVDYGVDSNSWYWWHWDG